MRYLPLVWAGLWRKPLRTTLLLSAIAAAFVLFGLLQGFARGLDSAQAQARSDVLMTFSRVYKLEPLPLAQLEEIRNIPGVASVSPILNLDALYGDPGRAVGAFGVDSSTIPATMPAMEIPADELARLRETPTGAVVSEPLAAQFGWRVGQRLPLRSAAWVNKDGSTNWPLDLVGVFKAPKSLLLSNALICNYNYLDKARTRGVGAATGFLIRISDPSQATEVARRIDERFANSSHETKTSTETELVVEQIKAIGDVGYIVTLVTWVVFGSLLFSLLFVLLLTARERSVEFAVLRTLGFDDLRLVSVVFAECGGLCLAAAGAGLGVSAITFPFAKNAFGFAAAQSGPVWVGGLTLALGLAAAATLPVVARALRLNVADTLAGR